MEILVLIKQVPDTEANITIQEKDINENGIKWIIAPYDEIALEEAVRLKEKHGDVHITVLSVGPERVVSSLRSAYAMGADSAVLIKTEEYNMLDSSVIAEAILKSIEGKQYDLILAGRQATDSDNGQVPIILATYMDCAIATFANAIEISDQTAKITCEVEGGEAIFEANLPLIMTANDRLNEPRYPSLKGIMSSKKKPIDTKELSSLGISTNAAIIVNAYVAPPDRPAGKILDNEDPAGKVKDLVHSLHNELKVI